MSVTKVKTKTEGQVKEKGGDERGEMVVAMKRGVVSKVTVPSMEFKGCIWRSWDPELWFSLGSVVRLRVLLFC